MSARANGVIAFLVIAALAAGAALSLGGGPVIVHEGSRLSVRQGGLVYVYDTTWRVERLYASGAVRRAGSDLSKKRPVELERLRRVMLRRMGVKTLEDIPADASDLKARLEQLGYL